MCNVLNQNPRFHASSTSPLARLVDIVHDWHSGPNQWEIKSDLLAEPEYTKARLNRVMRGICTDWYDLRGKDTVFDKGRDWPAYHEILWRMFPDSKMIVLVRDLKEVYASLLKNHLEEPLLQGIEKFPAGRMAQVFSKGESGLPPGIVGGPLIHIMHLWRKYRESSRVFFAQYEVFASEPEMAMRAIYKWLGEPYYKKHDFETVVDVSTDNDANYHEKFPHRGSGKIEYKGPCWEEYLEPWEGQEIQAAHPLFYQAFYPPKQQPRLTPVEWAEHAKTTATEILNFLKEEGFHAVTVERPLGPVMAAKVRAKFGLEDLEIEEAEASEKPPAPPPTEAG